jgi:AraC-like DNA-binding protein
MLETLHFLPKPKGYCPRVLGVIVSQAPPAHAVNFSVPAHVLLTLNVVLQGSLMHGQQVLPSSFATGAHTRSRRYQISPGAILLTLFCRANAALDLSALAPAQLADTWLPAQSVFKAWPQAPHSADAISTAQAMLACVSPEHLPVLKSPSRSVSSQRIQHALQVLAEQDLAAACTQLQMSERSLQRLFVSHWGISPKLVQRMLRIQRCIQLWDKTDAQHRNLADLAAQTGLADQAHLAREFRQLVGYAPGNLKRQSSSVQQHREDTLWALRTGSSLLAPLLQ